MIKGQCQVIGPNLTLLTLTHLSPLFYKEQNLTPFIINRINRQIIAVDLYFNQNQLSQRQQSMKVASPFVQFIPDCKKTMRRLRKKIYKFITSKHYHKKQQENRKDLIALLREREVPSFVVELLAKKKSVDLAAIKNLNVSVRLSLKDVVDITEKQESMVSQHHREWVQTSRLRSKQKSQAMIEMKERQSSCKRTLSSTEFQCDEEYEQYRSQQSPQQGFASIQASFNQDIEFHHFERGNSFLQIESSILSQQNLFKFQ